MGSVVFHREKGGLNTPAKMDTAYKHNMRMAFCENVDKSKSHLNRVLIDQGMSYYKYYNQRMMEGYKPYVHPVTGKPYAIKSNAVKMLDLRISVDRNEEKNNPLFDLDEFCERAKQFCIDKFGLKNIAGMTYHADEGGPHIHIEVIPLTPDGKLDAHYYMSPKLLSGYQTELADRMKDLGLTRGRERSVTDNRTIKQYYSEIKETQISDLPDPMPGEDVKNYKLRADAVYTQTKSRHHAEREKLNADIRKLKTEIRNQEPVLNDLVLTKRENERLKKELEAARSTSNQWADVARAVQHHLLPQEDEKRLGELVRAAAAAGKEYRIEHEKDAQKETDTLRGNK